MCSTPAELIQSMGRAISWEYNSCKTHALAVLQVRNLTYMVTRREKIKRSVCKVQEQIFNSYTKQLEQERVSGMPQCSLPHVRAQGQGLLTGCEGQTGPHLFSFHSSERLMPSKFLQCCPGGQIILELLSN